jgi:hypothetical protein
MAKADAIMGIPNIIRARKVESCKAVVAKIPPNEAKRTLSGVESRKLMAAEREKTGLAKDHSVDRVCRPALAE